MTGNGEEPADAAPLAEDRPLWPDVGCTHAGDVKPNQIQEGSRRRCRNLGRASADSSELLGQRAFGRHTFKDLVGQIRTRQAHDVTGSLVIWFLGLSRCSVRGRACIWGSLLGAALRRLDSGVVHRLEHLGVVLGVQRGRG